jgi:hypothetical protein
MRITQSFRDEIHRAALMKLPQINYLKKLNDLVQALLVENAPEACQAVFADPASRHYLECGEVFLKNGNQYLTLYRHYLLGHRTMSIRLDDASFSHAKEGTVEYKIADAVRKSGLFQKYYEQEALYLSVSERLTANLKRAKTYRSLFNVLEPELHQFIPAAPQPDSENLPAVFAPVVEDMKTLGAHFPKQSAA